MKVDARLIVRTMLKVVLGLAWRVGSQNQTSLLFSLEPSVHYFLTFSFTIFLTSYNVPSHFDYVRRLEKRPPSPYNGMRLLLIRHGETVDNVAGLYAGSRDSALTNHGVLQANRLGSYLSTNAKIIHVFSSDLQRAFKTAEAIRSAQLPVPEVVTRLALLREQDFGFFEGKHFFERTINSNKSGKEMYYDAHKDDAGFQDVESVASMRERTTTFVDQYLLNHFKHASEEQTVAVVAHGIILGHLWRVILDRFPASNVAVEPEVGGRVAMTLEHLGGWSNTGWLDLEIKSPRVNRSVSVSCESTDKPTEKSGGPTSQLDSCEVTHTQVKEPISSTSPSQLRSVPRSHSSPLLLDFSLVVKAVNSQEHLKGLKKTRGGIGSSKHDDSQKTIGSFFKKRKLG